MKVERRLVLTGLLGLGLGLWPACRLDARGKRTAGAGWLARLPKNRQDALTAALEALLPGALAAGAVIFIDHWLSQPPLDALQHQFDLGGVLLDKTAQRKFRAVFASCSRQQQDEVLREFQAGTVHPKFDSKKFLERMITLAVESYLGDPKYGGNRELVGWKSIDWVPCWWSPKHVGHLVVRRSDLPH
jgi:hypothetical protein